jgi:hypothetical protein
VFFGTLGAKLLFDAISAAYESAGIIVTTNLSFEKWTNVGQLAVIRNCKRRFPEVAAYSAY